MSRTGTSIAGIRCSMHSFALRSHRTTRPSSSPDISSCWRIVRPRRRRGRGRDRPHLVGVQLHARHRTLVLELALMLAAAPRIEDFDRLVLPPSEQPRAVLREPRRHNVSRVPLEARHWRRLLAQRVVAVQLPVPRHGHRLRSGAVSAWRWRNGGKAKGEEGARHLPVRTDPDAVHLLRVRALSGVSSRGVDAAAKTAPCARGAGAAPNRRAAGCGSRCRWWHSRAAQCGHSRP